jgi:hypothetical protein
MCSGRNGRPAGLRLPGSLTAALHPRRLPLARAGHAEGAAQGLAIDRRHVLDVPAALPLGEVVARRLADGVGGREAGRRGRRRTHGLAVDGHELHELPDAERGGSAQERARAQGGQELGVRAAVPGHAVQLCDLAQHRGLQHGHRHHACHGDGIAGAGGQGVSQNVGVDGGPAGLRPGTGQLVQDDLDCRGSRRHERRDQLLAPVVDRVEAIARLGEVDGCEGRRLPAGDLSEQGALVGERARHRLGHRPRQSCAGDAVRERIGQDVALPPRIALVQGRLGHDHGPIRMPAARGAHGIHHRALLGIQGLGYGEDQMRAVLGEGYVLRRIVGRLAQAAGIEEADDGRLGGEVEDARGPGAGAEAGADLGVAGPCEGTDDGGLAALHLADEPYQRRQRARPVGNRVGRGSLAHLASIFALAATLDGPASGIQQTQVSGFRFQISGANVVIATETRNLEPDPWRDACSSL